MGGRGEETREGTGPGRGCQRGQNGRILAGRHQVDTCPDPDQCPGCEPCTEAHCQTCRRNHAPVTCPGCLHLARTNLARVAGLAADLPHQATGGREAFHVHMGIPGGDALVMLAPAAPHLAPGTIRAPYADPGDVRPPLDVLVYWANAWAAHRRQEPTAPTMARIVGYLDNQLHHMAAHPAFPQLANDLARVLASLENILHAGDRPDLSRVPCLSCGARLVKVWADGDHPDRDHHLCRVCGEVYDAGRYERAKHDQLHSQGADRFVPVTDAIAVTGRPEQTVRGWIRDGLVTVRRDVKSGRLLVWWPDVRDRHRATPTRKRSTTP